MIRLFGVILIIGGLLVFAGNFSGLYQTIWWLGTMLCVVGGFVYMNAERWDAMPPASEE